MMAPLLGVVLLAAAAIPSLVLAGLLHADAQAAAVQRAVAHRVRTSVVPREEPHEEELYPARQAPTDLGRAYDQPGQPWRRPNVPGMAWMTGGYLRARVPLPWPQLQRRLAGERALRTPTQEFELIVEPLTADWCDSCRGVVADGEPPHLFCGPGRCGCPCRLPLIGRPPRGDRRSDLVGALSGVEDPALEVSVQ